ncbi:MAG: DUF4954 family protein, partial [Paraprevotella sp.]|nr:DUF4954 family protein [Paraprevotella sp.]
MHLESDITPTYRPLTNAETEQLQRQYCTADDWTLLRVHPDFDPAYLSHVCFSGVNRIGCFRQTLTLEGGLRRHSGIYHATLHDTTVGNDCLIDHIHGYIARYDIGEQVVIARSGVLAVEGESCFGEGTEIQVLSETGGREIILHSGLSSQEAYLQAMYRHDRPLIDRLRTMARNHADGNRSRRGQIGNGSLIEDCGRIVNVRIGPFCRIEGSTLLENGTVCSQEESPTLVGAQVFAREFIFQRGSRITAGAILNRCDV